MPKIDVDGSSYEIDDFSEAARRSYESVRAVATELQRLEALSTLTTKARSMYEKELEGEASTLNPVEAKADGKRIEVLGRYFMMADFGETSKVAIESLRACDIRETTLKVEIAIAQTALSGYTTDLKFHLNANE